MNWLEFWEAFKDAKRTFDQADSEAGQMADILSGRLRKVDRYYLKKLKHELRDFNANTGKWKGQP